MRNQSKAEDVLLRELEALGLTGWERSPKDVPGSPDLCLRDRMPAVAVFLDGCFWHGCPEHYKTPSKRRGFWRVKVTRNRIRDRGIAWPCQSCGAMTGLLPETGWLVVRVWEHEDPKLAALRVREAIRSSGGFSRDYGSSTTET